MQKVTQCLILSKRSYCVFAPQGFVTKCFLIFIVNEVKNFATNNIFKLLELVTYWEPCIIGQSCTKICAKEWRSYIEEFRGSEAVEGFYCKFIYGDYRVQGQRFCTRSETSFYYSGLLFQKVFPQVFFIVELFCFIGFRKSSYLVLFTFPLCMILTIIFFNKVYS